MTHAPAWHPAAKALAWLAALLSASALVGSASIVISGWLTDGVERSNGSRKAAAERSDLGGYFEAVSAVFSGLALLLLVITLMFQQRELRMQRHELSLQREELAASRNELRRSAEADLRSLHVQLTQMQMDDPSLAEVWNDYPGTPPDTLRRNLFANLTFGHYLLAYRWGGYSDEEMLVHARNLVRSPAFNLYWAASREAKDALPTDTAESRLLRIFEQAIAEANRPGTPSPGPDA